MAIEINNAAETPALVFNRVMLQDLHIRQRLEEDDSKPPHYTLGAELRMYAVDGDGKRHFSPKTDTIQIVDYLAVAMAKAQQGDLDLVQAAEAIENALVQIVIDQRPDLGGARRV